MTTSSGDPTLIPEGARTSVKLVRDLVRNGAGSFRLAPLLRPPRAGLWRIAIQSYSIHLAQMFRTIVAELLARSDVELSFLVLSHPEFPASTERSLREFVRRELGIPEDRILGYHEALWERFDLVIYNDVFARFPLASTRNCLLTHGPLLEPRFFEPGLLRKTVADFDVVAVCGRLDLERVASRIRTLDSPPELVSVGYPFLDRLSHPGVDRDSYLKGLALDPTLPAVLLAPHWKTLRDADGARRFEEVASALAELDVAMIIKLHACSLVRSMAGGIDWRARLGAFERSGRVAVDYDPDDIPALAHCDVLVTEQSSRSLAFMLLGKPVIELGRDGMTLAQAKRMAVIDPGVHSARSADELRALLGNGSPLRPRPEAARLAAECIDNHGQATRRFLELVERSLPPRADGRDLTAVGVRLATTPEALGRPRDSSAVLGDHARLRERLEEDGYLYLRGFFDGYEILEARRQVVEFLDARGLVDRSKPLMECGAASTGKIPVESEDGRFPAVRRVLHGERMLGLYRMLLGGEVRHYDHIWMRLMNPGQATGPHCDIVYMGRGTANLYTSWVPLGDVPAAHGALLILEGSHRLAHKIQRYLRMDIDEGRNWTRPRFRHGKLFRGGDYSRNPRGVQRQFGRRWLTTDYSAGDLMLFHAQTMHGSLDNVSRTLRLSADTRFQLASEPADERWVGPRASGHTAKP
jgi:hypothetical protein